MTEKPRRISLLREGELRRQESFEPEKAKLYLWLRDLGRTNVVTRIRFGEQTDTVGVQCTNVEGLTEPIFYVPVRSGTLLLTSGRNWPARPKYGFGGKGAVGSPPELSIWLPPSVSLASIHIAADEVGHLDIDGKAGEELPPVYVDSLSSSGAHRTRIRGAEIVGGLSAFHGERWLVERCNLSSLTGVFDVRLPADSTAIFDRITVADDTKLSVVSENPTNFVYDGLPAGSTMKRVEMGAAYDDSHDEVAQQRAFANAPVSRIEGRATRAPSREAMAVRAEIVTFFDGGRGRDGAPRDLGDFDY